jgi:restriction endonuclease S subunit
LNQLNAYPSFIYYITKSIYYKQWINSVLIQATIQNVSAEKYSLFLIALPNFAEQQAIAAFLDRETGKIDPLMAQVETAIEKLQKYRSSLISAAVTGKIDVREAV